MMEAQNRSINRTRGSISVILGRSWRYAQDLVCENSRLHKSIMRKMSYSNQEGYRTPKELYLKDVY